MAQETWVQSQVESYQRLKKWYLIRSCLTLSIIRYGSRVKWRNPGIGVVPSPTPWYSSCQKGRLESHYRLWSLTLFYLLTIRILLFLMLLYIIKMDTIRHYLLPKLTALKPCNRKYEYVIV